MRVSVCNRQRGCAADPAAVKRLVRELAGLAQARTRGEGPWREVTVHLLDDAGIAPVNRAVMGHEGGARDGPPTANWRSISPTGATICPGRTTARRAGAPPCGAASWRGSGASG
jgi:hypothetical protein